MADWTETKEKLRGQIIRLTDNKVLIDIGSREELISRLEIKLGKTREVIARIIKDL